MDIAVTKPSLIRLARKTLTNGRMSDKETYRLIFFFFFCPFGVQFDIEIQRKKQQLKTIHDDHTVRDPFSCSCLLLYASLLLFIMKTTWKDVSYAWLFLFFFCCHLPAFSSSGPAMDGHVELLWCHLFLILSFADVVFSSY